MEVRKDSNITFEGDVLNFKYEKKNFIFGGKRWDKLTILTNLI